MLDQLLGLISAVFLAAEGGERGTGKVIAQITAHVPEIITHIIGFLIVLWILKKFAWRPLLNVMDQRHQKIASEFKRIEDISQEAQQRREEYESRIRLIETEAREHINAAVNEGRRVASEIQANARRDAEKIREKARATCEIEVAKAREQLREEVVNLTLLATEKIIHERLDDEKHRALITEFVDQLEN